MDRRTFLMGAPLVFGLREFLASFDSLALAQDKQDDGKKPAWLDAALKRMKESGLPGLVIVAPAAAGEREKLGERLCAIVEKGDDDTREIMLEAVFICLTPELAKAHAPADGNRVLLSPKGEKIAADTVELETYADAKKFVESFRALLHGPKGERLRANAAAVRESLKEDDRKAVEDALDRIDTDGAAPDDAAARVAAFADRIVPWIVLARMECVHKSGRETLRRIVRDLHAKRCGQDAPARLPYGTTLQQEVIDTCEGCGMARAGREGRRFLTFLIE